MEGTADDRTWRRELDAEGSFVDEDWISGLRFDLPTQQGDSPITVTGLSGVGSSWVVLRATSPERGAFALRLPRELWSFPSYIRELPPELGGGAHYDPARLERKLDRLVGDPMLDRVAPPYSDLYRTIVDNLYHWPPFDELEAESDVARFVLPFGVRLPGTRARLSQLASASSSRDATKRWAMDTLTVLERIEGPEAAEPDRIHDNPIYVWGAAQLSGYFIENADRTARLVGDRVSATPQQLNVFIWQGWALAHLLSSFGVTDGFGSFFNSVREEVQARGDLLQSE